MTLSRRTCFAHPDLWKIKTGIQDRKGSLGKAFSAGQGAFSRKFRMDFKKTESSLAEKSCPDARLRR